MKSMIGTIDEAFQVSIILTTFPKSFDQFKINYGMNKLKFNLIQLFNKLTTFESMIKNNKSKTCEVNVAEPSSFGLNKRKRSAGKAKAKPKKKQVQNKKKNSTTNKLTN